MEFSLLYYYILRIINSGFRWMHGKKFVVSVECDSVEEQCVVANSQWIILSKQKNSVQKRSRFIMSHLLSKKNVAADAMLANSWCTVHSSAADEWLSLIDWSD